MSRPKLPALPAGYSLRRPASEDAPAVLALMNACDVAEYGEPDSELDDLIHDWQASDLQSDGWLILAAGGSMVAYGLVSTWSGGFDIQCVVQPDLQRSGLENALLTLAEQRAREMLATTGTPPVARLYATHTNAPMGEALVAAGFQPEKYHFRMKIDQAEPPPDPVWSAGCQLRTVRPGLDDETVYRFIQNAFARPDWTPQPFEEWRNYMMRPDHFVPDLWFLLKHGDELVGAALCYDYEPYGWVRQLAVDTGWRKQGIGSALLQHVFGVFFRRGQPRVALGVEASNKNAYRLYERLGMRRVRQFDEYRKRLD